MASARVLPLLIALLLGVGASLLVACGGTRGGVPTADANRIVDDLDAVGQAVDAGDCQAATSALARVRQEVQGLPASTAKSLVDRLQRSVDNLQQRVPAACRAAGTTTTDTTTTDTTPTDTTPTTTTSTNTTPTTTTSTNTTPTTTTSTNTTPTTTTSTNTTPTTTTGGGGSGGTGGTSRRRGQQRRDGRVPLMAGQVIAGRYELTRRLGVGGMSTVHLAFDRRLERQVAVKLLAEHLAHDEQFVTRFRREALSVAQLVHPNIVQVFDFGMDEPSGRHYLVMEYVRGQSGAELLREHGHLGVDETLSLVAQACLGLQDAHRHGVVHRDVKPGNLLRAEDGVTKLADFGIAKAADDVSGITQVGSVLGTAAYLAPEQAHGEAAGPAADIYALGVVDLPAARRGGCPTTRSP